MTSKYTIARELIDQLHQYADSNGLDKTDVEEATLILLIQALKNSRGSESMRGCCSMRSRVWAPMWLEFTAAAAIRKDHPESADCLEPLQGSTLQWVLMHYIILAQLHSSHPERLFNEDPAHPRFLL